MIRRLPQIIAVDPSSTTRKLTYKSIVSCETIGEDLVEVNPSLAKLNQILALVVVIGINTLTKRKKKK